VSDTNDIQTWRVEQSEEVMDCRIFRVHRDQAQTADGAKQGRFFTLKAPPWVNVIPITTNDELVCVRQFRHGTGRITLETPAGLGEHDETPETTAARELREETGYSAPQLAVLCQFSANPAFLDNIVTLTDPTAWDEHEELAVVLVPLAELPAMLARGDFENGVTVAALSRFLLYRHGIVPLQEGES
jgi:8-oxo-dGTP pyrophosphatase MutT (NUDIX family)